LPLNPADCFDQVRAFCAANADPAKVVRDSRYFSEGYDGYGLDQKAMEAQRDLWLADWLPELGAGGLLELGDRLTASGKYEEASFALLFAMELRREWSPAFFGRIGRWWDDGGIRNWAQCDIGAAWLVAGHINARIVQLEALYKWVNAASRWKRRAAAVAPLNVYRARTYPLPSLLDVLEPLMSDREKVVQQGVGATLKQFWTAQPAPTEAFLLKWKPHAAKLIVRLATEKMEKAQRKEFKR